MNKYFWLPILALWLTACGATNAATPASTTAARPGAVTVEIAYLNHPPVRPVLSEVDKLLATYGDRVSVAHYDFDTPDGQAFAKTKGLIEHTPIAIFINGSMQFTVSGHAVKFYSFPQGQGTGMVPEGGWTVADLQAVLDQATAKTP